MTRIWLHRLNRFAHVEVAPLRRIGLSAHDESRAIASMHHLNRAAISQVIGAVRPNLTSCRPRRVPLDSRPAPKGILLSP